jgi:GDP-L-fucose synthase
MRILLTGGNGLLGRSLRRQQPELKPRWVIVAPASSELDLRNQAAVELFFKSNRVDLVIHAAAVVGGIAANVAHPVAFLSDNLLMNTIVINAAHKTGIDRLLFLGSSCMYPKDVMRPLIEEDILTAPLEPTNEGYALAKIVGAKHCETIAKQSGFAYRTLIPCNLYGPDDHFGSEKSHLVAAALSKVHAAKARGERSVTIWGDGKARREFLYVADLSRFILTIAEEIEKLPQFLNVGARADYSVDRYYELAAETVGYDGAFTHDLDAPVGMIKKLLDSSRAAAFGWYAPTSLVEGMKLAYEGLQRKERSR